MKDLSISILQDSIDTSVDMKIFKSREESAVFHIFHSKNIKFPLSKCKILENFDVKRLKKNAELSYPKEDRPRGLNDIKSVRYYKKLLKEKIDIPHIWIVKRNNKYILLDGSHRIVASYIY
jgi:hypothetical protein